MNGCPHKPGEAVPVAMQSPFGMQCWCGLPSVSIFFPIQESAGHTRLPRAATMNIHSAIPRRMPARRSEPVEQPHPCKNRDHECRASFPGCLQRQDDHHFHQECADESSSSAAVPSSYVPSSSVPSSQHEQEMACLLQAGHTSTSQPTTWSCPALTAQSWQGWCAAMMAASTDSLP